MKRVLVISDNEFLFQKINLALKDLAECKRHSGNLPTDYDVCFFDKCSFAKAPRDAVIMGKDEECDLRLPFSIEEIRSRIENLAEQSARMSLDQDTRSVKLNGRTVKLTELEFSLLSLLANNPGKSISGDEILRSVWGEGVDRGIVNVYIHYLREKLEKDGEKIIISSRKSGYKIDERFLEDALC